MNVPGLEAEIILPPNTHQIVTFLNSIRAALAWEISILKGSPIYGRRQNIQGAAHCLSRHRKDDLFLSWLKLLYEHLRN